MRSRIVGQQLGAVAFVAVAALTGAPAMAQEKIEVKVGITVADDSINAEEGRMWGKLTELYTNGRVTTKVFPSSQLGKERAQLEGLVTGSHETFLHISAITGKFPSVRFWDLPFLFEDTDQVMRTVHSDLWKDWEAEMAKENIVYLGTFGYGYRQFAVRNKAYNSPADLVGQKHRIPGGKSKMMLFEALGANVSTVAMAELYQAMSSGVVDSQDNPIGIIYAQKLHEVSNYISLINYNYNPLILIAGKPFWDKLDKEAQAVLKRAAWEVQGWSIKYAELDDEVYLKKILADRPQIKINELDPATLPAWREKSKPVYEAFKEEAGPTYAENVFNVAKGGYYKPGTLGK
ncbi:MAG: TRAP transporter substrate-binding protein [Alphaproteobacteria bacterium]